MKLSPFNGTFGMPPSSYVSDSVIINSMPILRITPCTPNFESGLTLFSVSEDWKSYKNILGGLGYELEKDQIQIAFIADNFPTDTFTNEYGETFLQKFTDVASQGMQQLSQMTGSRTGTQAIQKIGGGFKNIGEGMGGIGEILSGVGTGFEETGKALESIKGKMQGNKFLGGTAKLIDKMVGGYRVDFPNIWTNSGFTPSYSVTVRLYNPNPASPEATEQYIIGPLAVILCLSIPRSDDGKTFNWPFFHKINCPGIYNLNPAVITNVTVVKGGDQQQISFNQKLAMVDVRIDFTSLYNTMVLEENQTFEQERPTVRSYLSSLKENDTSLYRTRSQMNKDAGNLAGATEQGNAVTITSTPTITDQQKTEKDKAASKRLPPTVETQEVTDRVPQSTSQKQTSLEESSPADLFMV